MARNGVLDRHLRREPVAGGILGEARGCAPEQRARPA
jgi:hypothetical protein